MQAMFLGHDCRSPTQGTVLQSRRRELNDETTALVHYEGKARRRYPETSDNKRSIFLEAAGFLVTAASSWLSLVTISHEGLPLMLWGGPLSGIGLHRRETAFFS